jgi:putative SOS response-associated peptidase YedK
MCFTIEIHLSRKSIENRFSVNSSALYDFDFNYFYRAFDNPMIPVISMDDPAYVQLRQWGLIPSWVKSKDQANKIRKGTYNARAESLHEKPSFREALGRGRCLILAGGFFEWQLVNKKKIPWYITHKSGEPFAFAGLCDSWRDSLSGDIIRTCSIITTKAGPMMERIHNTKLRMPVILRRDREEEWISGDISLLKRKHVLLPVEDSELNAHTVAPNLIQAGANPSDPGIVLPYTYENPGTLF